MHRRSIMFAFAALPTMVIAGPTLAAEMAFTQAEFQRAQAAGQPILVEITAPWCPVCAKQKPILQKLQADAAFRDLQVFQVDFDSQKDIVKAMGAQMQSTLIVFRGKDERGRSTGQTDADAIRALLDKSKA